MRLICCALFSIVAIPLMAAEVYRWIDDEGNVIYSDRPTNAAGIELVIIEGPRVATQSASAATTQRAPRVAANQPAVSEVTTERERVEPTPEERAQNCATAEQRSETYDVSHRLYRNAPSGEREYLNDAEIDEARARAAADVATWCS